MEDVNRIRLIYICAAFLCVCVLAFGGGYYINDISLHKELAPQERVVIEEPKEEPPVMDIAQSAASVSPYEFVLGENNGEVIVYYSDGETEYSITNIPVDSLPEELQMELRAGKPIYSEEELYNFLESYSS